jgi:hypothetical protein
VHEWAQFLPIAEAIGDQFPFAGAADRLRTLDSPICHGPSLNQRQNQCQKTGRPGFPNCIVPGTERYFRSANDPSFRRCASAPSAPGTAIWLRGAWHRITLVSGRCIAQCCSTCGQFRKFAAQWQRRPMAACRRIPSARKAVCIKLNSAETTRGQVREPLDILAWAASFEDCMLRPT